MSCVSENLKNISLKASEKVRNDVSIESGEIKKDTIK